MNVYGVVTNTGTQWIADQFQYSPANFNTTTLTAPKMPKLTRLTTSGDWTIALNEHNKLVAFDSNGQSVTAVGSLIYCNGRAWMWNGDKLWSGVMEHVEGEEEARKNEEEEKNKKKIEARARIVDKYNKRIEALQHKKYDEMNKVR